MGRGAGREGPRQCIAYGNPEDTAVPGCPMLLPLALLPRSPSVPGVDLAEDVGDLLGPIHRLLRWAM